MSASPEAPPRRHESATLGDQRTERLGGYTDPDGRERELRSMPAAQASTLVVDRLAPSGADPRLVAHLYADEPAQNARIVAAMYLGDARGRRCRPLQGEDFGEAALSEEEEGEEALTEARVIDPGELCDADGRSYRLEVVANGSNIPELRWRRREREGPVATVTMRSAMASLESYEPVRSVSARTIKKHGDNANLSVAVLRGELERVRNSPIVLNRGLREAVLQAVVGGLSMSEIAIRCGRIKRDANGRESGETSWLARRIGTLPEGGRCAPTPWVHADVLALIAREGLGMAPREVEVG